MNSTAGRQAPITLTTARLRLRPWRPHFAALNADPRVMEHFPKVLTAEESDRQAAGVADHIQRRSFRSRFRRTAGRSA